MIANIFAQNLMVLSIVIVCLVLKDSDYYHQTLILIFDINHLFAHSYRKKYRKWWNFYLGLTYGTLADTTTLSQSGPGGRGNEELFHIPESSGTGDSSLDGFEDIQDTLWRGFAPLQRCSRRFLKTQPTGLAQCYSFYNSIAVVVFAHNSVE